MNAMAWNKTDMLIMVNMKLVGLMPPGNESKGKSEYVVEPVIGSTTLS
tara:strand:- start:364 stop:507 length:144 start_codon:yes stop_codon:yes gene_type:complete